MNPSVELQRSIQLALNSGTWPVYDQLPNGEVMPFIIIGEETLLTADTKTDRGTSHLITVHTWSDSISTKEVKEMNYFIIDTLVRSPIAVDGFLVLLSSLSFNQTFKEQDENTTKYHGVSQIIFTLQEV